MRGKCVRAEGGMGAEKQSGEPRVDIVAFQRLVEGQGRKVKVLGLSILGV